MSGRRATERRGPLRTDGVMIFTFETERPDFTVHVRVAEGTYDFDLKSSCPGQVLPV